MQHQPNNFVHPPPTNYAYALGIKPSANPTKMQGYVNPNPTPTGFQFVGFDQYGRPVYIPY
jgi:hypothetical protein